MTHRAEGAGGGVPRIWVLPTAVLTAILGVTAAGVLSRSLILDLVAWWPVWLLVALLALVARGRRVGRLRLSGLVPLVATGALVVFVGGHVAGWALMPSASQTLVGPVGDRVSTVALSAHLDGEIHLSGGADFLYVVESIRRGGDLGISDATEQIQGNAMSVMLTETDDPGFLTFSGWDISLSSAPTWNLTVDGEIAGDLSGLRVTGLQLGGSGSLVLGLVTSSTPVSVSGVFELVVSPAAVARVVGEASVPESWVQLPDGWQSPADGAGWVISVPAGSTLTITER